MLFLSWLPLSLPLLLLALPLLANPAVAWPIRDLRDHVSAAAPFASSSEEAQRKRLHRNIICMMALQVPTENVKLYDDSLSGWVRDPALPMEPMAKL